MRRISAEWEAAILVCARCSRRAKGGFGKKGRTSLAKLLRGRGNGRKGRKADLGVIEMPCQKICPRKGVLAIDAARPKDWIVIPCGAGRDEAAGWLGLPG